MASKQVLAGTLRDGSVVINSLHPLSSFPLDPSTTWAQEPLEEFIHKVQDPARTASL